MKHLRLNTMDVFGALFFGFIAAAIAMVLTIGIVASLGGLWILVGG